MRTHRKFVCVLAVAGCCFSGIAFAQVGVGSSGGANVGVGGANVGVGGGANVQTPPPPNVNVQGNQSGSVRSGDSQASERSNGSISTSPRDNRGSSPDNRRSGQN